MKFSKYTVPIIFVFLCFIIYSNVLSGPFVFDDGIYIADNYKIQSISNFFKDLSGTRYVGLLSFAINYYFGGLNPFGYHLVNIIIHIVNAMLVYVLVGLAVDRIKPLNCLTINPTAYSEYLPFTVALIFLVHPIQTQAVSYISQRFTSLATLFYLLAIVLYIKARCYGLGHRHSQDSPIAYHPLPIALYILSILSAIFAMKTKEISFTLPFVMLLYEWTFFDSQDLRIRKRFLCLLPFFLTLTIIPLELYLSRGMGALKAGADVGKMITELQIMDIENVPVYSYFLTQFRVILTYIRLLFFPVSQAFTYDYPFSKSIFEPATFGSGIFILAAVIFAAYLHIRSRRAGNGHGLLISFGILWFFITLSVESSVIPIKDVIFEHRLYLPSIGFILSAATALFYGFDYLEAQTKKKLWKHLLSLVVAVAVILSFAAYKRNVLWADNYLMHLDNVKKASNKADPHVNLGRVYFERGMLDEAEREFLTALRIRPDFALDHYNLGLLYHTKGKLDKAMQEYQIAIRLKPDHELSHDNLGSVYYAQGRLDEAIQEYRTAIRLKPDDKDAHHNLGILYAKQDLLDKAMEELKIASRLNPEDPEVHYNMGNIYYKQGRMDGAAKEFQITIKLKPDHAEAHKKLKNILNSSNYIPPP